MQTYIGDIITNVRRDTRNADDIPSSTNLVGIQTDDFLRYANYAQERLQSRIVKAHPFTFEETIEISLVANQQSYTILDHLLYGTRIKKVEFSSTGLAMDYRRIPPTNPYCFYNGTGYPQAYSRRNGNVLLEPTPSATTGTIRVTYQRALDRLELRRDTVSGTPSGATIHLTTASSDIETRLASTNYICISDKFGTVMLYNGVVSSYSPSTDTITLAANVSTYLVTGYTLANLSGAYITLGQYTTTHSKLPDEAERFLSEYMAKRVFKRESSKDSIEIDKELLAIELDIVALYENPDEDIKRIPDSDYNYLLYSFNDY